MSAIVVAMVRHELVGIDAQGELCSCGVKDPAFVEHLADMLAPALGVNRYWPKNVFGSVSEAPRIGWREAA